MTIKDNQTPRLGLLLPNADNFLQDDVERLIESFGLLDILVVMRDQTTGKIADDQLSAIIAKLDANGKLLTAQIPSSVVQKGPDGKIDASLMPSIAVIDTFVVPDEASMLGLTCQAGDIAIRSDLGRTFILMQSPPSSLSNWRELTSTNVSSVNGQVGAVTGLAKAGTNNDINRLTALSGPLTLGGDGVDDYDAVTMRQARNMGGGSGPTQTGVMNYGVGNRRLHDSRAWLASYEVFGDGQLLLRATYPDLWAYAQLVGAIADTAWCSDPTKRGNYSTGDGSTTFRVPDINGVKKAGDESGKIVGASIPGLYGRGDGGVSSNNGLIRQNSAPNIYGSIGISIPGQAHINLDAPVGALGNVASVNNVLTSVPNMTTGNGTRGLTIDASKYSSVYGRDATGEVHSNEFIGVWVIRASGAFTAANTSFSVLNGDAAAPANGTQVAGGKITSTYQIAGADAATAQMWAQKNIGDLDSSIVLSPYNVGNTKRAWLSFNTAGVLSGATLISLQSGGKFLAPVAGGAFNSSPSTARFVTDPLWSASPTYTPYAGGGVGGIGGAWRSFVSFGGLSYSNQHPSACITLSEDYDLVGLSAPRSRIFQFFGENNTPVISFANDQGQGNNTVQWAGASDITVKDAVTDYNGEQSLDNINAMEFKTFIYKDDPTRTVRRGIIAQQVMEIDPQYVHKNEQMACPTMTLDHTPLLLDALAAIKVLSTQIAALQAQK